MSVDPVAIVSSRLGLGGGEGRPVAGGGLGPGRPPGPASERTGQGTTRNGAREGSEPRGVGLTAGKGSNGCQGRNSPGIPLRSESGARQGPCIVRYHSAWDQCPLPNTQRPPSPHTSNPTPPSPKPPKPHSSASTAPHPDPPISRPPAAHQNPAPAARPAQVQLAPGRPLARHLPRAAISLAPKRGRLSARPACGVRRAGRQRRRIEEVPCPG